MLAIVTSIGEPTTELCCWSLKRNGFTVKVIEDPQTTLFDKLKEVYETLDEDFVRVDADVIANKNLTPERVEAARLDHQWWVQFLTYDWFKQDTAHGGVQYIKSEALPALRSNIERFREAERPESQMYRLREFMNPRRCDWHPCIMGLNGYGQTDIKRIIETKHRRNQMQNYDFELVEKLRQLA